jgi:hypothetical protein
MLNTLSTLVWDAQGYVELDVLPKQTIGDTRRRLNRVATLDGSAVANDSGYSDADRTIDLRWQPQSSDQEALVERLVRTYSRIQVSTRSGVFLALLETYVPDDQEAQLRLLVLSKLSP